MRHIKSAKNAICKRTYLQRVVVMATIGLSPLLTWFSPVLLLFLMLVSISILTTNRPFYIFN